MEMLTVMVIPAEKHSGRGQEVLSLSSVHRKKNMVRTLQMLAAVTKTVINIILIPSEKKVVMIRSSFASAILSSDPSYSSPLTS